jgi:Family of unknown function (DUF5670)
VHVRVERSARFVGLIQESYADVTRFTSAALDAEVDMLWTIFVVLVILWLLGFSLHIGGGLIHLVLVVGLVVLVINLLSGRRTAG